MNDRKNKIGIIFLATFLLVFLVVGCSKENSDWETAKKANTESTYQGFVVKYPNGKYIGEASNAVEKLKWEIASKENTVSSIEAFIKSYPKSSYLPEAQKMLDKLTSVPVTDEYRETCLTWARDYLYKDKKEEEVYEDVKKRNMHYAYTGFLMLFPNTTHSAEIENLLKGFRIYDSPGDKDVVLTYDYLKEHLNYNGVDSVYRWNDAFSGFFGPGESFMIIDTSVDGPDANVTFQNKTACDYAGPVLCIGNLQILVGTFKPMENGKIGISAKIIYPVNKP